MICESCQCLRGWVRPDRELPEPMEETQFLDRIRLAFRTPYPAYRLTGRPVTKCALCGGAGSFLISKAYQKGRTFIYCRC